MRVTLPAACASPGNPNPALWYSFFGCHGRRPSLICSGYFVGSPASLYASRVITADAMWCCPPALPVGGSVMITSGRIMRISRT